MAAITDLVKILLNNLNKRAKQAKLGDVIAGIQDGSDLTLADDAVDNDAVLDASIKFQDKKDRDYVLEDFSRPIALSGLKTNTNIRGFASPDNSFQCYNIGDKTIDLIWQPGQLDIGGDQTNAEGSIITVGGVGASAPCQFTMGTDAVSFECKINVATVAGADDCLFGFKKLAALNADYEAYDEMCAINIDQGQINIETILNNGATSKTDTTGDITDGQFLRAKIDIDPAVGLSSAIALANELRTDFNLHLADVTQHTTAADTANVVSASVAYNLASLIILVTEMIVNYDVHEDDSELGAAWAYHAAQETGDASPASTTAPTDLPECIALLNDLKAKFKIHDDDATSHGAQTQYPIAAVAAGSCTFTTGINTDTLTAPATTINFQFDDGEIVVPFIQLVHNATTADSVLLNYIKIEKS